MSFLMRFVPLASWPSLPLRVERRPFFVYASGIAAPLMTKLHARLGPAVLAFLGLLLFAGVLVVFPAFSGFAAGVFKFDLVIAQVVLLDVFVLTKTNTYQLIVVEKNLPYALVLTGYLIAAGLTIATA